MREAAESTKVRIVFDASARANDRSPSLNDCLETGPPPQNLIWEILTRNRLQPVTLNGDLKGTSNDKTSFIILKDLDFNNKNMKK